MSNLPTTWAIYISDVLNAGLAFGFFIQAGLLIINLLKFRRLYTLERMCLAMGLGIGSIAIQMLIYGMIRIPFSFVGITAPWLVIWSIYIWHHRSRFSKRWVIDPTYHLPKLTRVELLIVIALGLTFSVVLFNATIHPIFEWDGWQSGILKHELFFTVVAYFPILVTPIINSHT